MKRAGRIFAVRFYEWAKQDFEREIQEDYPLLGTVNVEAARRLIPYLRRLSQADQVRVAHALVKRFHPDALEVLGQEITAEDKRWIDAADQARSVPTEEEDREFQDEMRHGTSRVGRSKVNRAANAALEPITGKPAGRAGANEWYYELHGAGWLVRTHIDTGGSYYELAYAHDLFAGEQPLAPFVSVLSWLGIGQTKWRVRSDLEIPTAVESLARACAHFLAAVPQLLNGLDE
jgi:hypothetical protein